MKELGICYRFSFPQIETSTYVNIAGKTQMHVLYNKSFNCWLPGNESPFEIVRRRQPLLEREIVAQFGEHVLAKEVHDNQNNALLDRTSHCIYLGNSSTGYFVLSLRTWKVLDRSHIQILPMTNGVVDRMKLKALKSNKNKKGVEIQKENWSIEVN